MRGSHRLDGADRAVFDDVKTGEVKEVSPQVVQRFIEQLQREQVKV